MKQTDLFTIFLVASIGVFSSFFLSQMFLGNPDEASVKYKALSGVIEKDLVAPDPEIFNSTAINPTVEVYIGRCEDIDQNGILDEAELEECNQKNQAAVQQTETEQPEAREE